MLSVGNVGMPFGSVVFDLCAWWSCAPIPSQAPATTQIASVNTVAHIRPFMCIPPRPLAASFVPRAPLAAAASVNKPSLPRLLFRIFLHPVVHELRDVIAVFLQHHLVTVPVNPHVLEAHELRLYARLIEPLGQAMVVLAVISALCGEVYDRNLLQVRQLARGLRL